MPLQVRYLNSDVGSNDLLKLCEQPDLVFSTDQIILKSDNTTTLRRLTIDIGEIVVKRYNTKNLWHLIRRNFQTSRAENCYRQAVNFNSKGIKTPESLAVIKRTFGPVSGQSWYISRYIPSVTLLEFLSTLNWKEPFQSIAGKVIELFQSLINYDLSHGDMKATNLLIREGELFVVDLDAARKHRISSMHKLALQKDKTRFLKNWDSIPELREAFAHRIEKIGL